MSIHCGGGAPCPSCRHVRHHVPSAKQRQWGRTHLQNRGARHSRRGMSPVSNQNAAALSNGRNAGVYYGAYGPARPAKVASSRTVFAKLALTKAELDSYAAHTCRTARFRDTADNKRARSKAGKLTPRPEGNRARRGRGIFAFLRSESHATGKRLDLETQNSPLTCRAQYNRKGNGGGKRNQLS